MQGKRMNEKTWVIVAVVAALLVVTALASAWFYRGNKNDREGQEKSFTVVVVHSDGSEKSFRYTSKETYVGDVLQAEGLISGEMAQYGMYIKEVDGEKAVYEEDNAYWSLFVGDVLSATGVDMTPIEDGATYKLVYTKG